LGEIAGVVGGRIRGAGEVHRVVAAVTIDSRRAEPGTLFVPLPGEHADGHAFVVTALEAGAAGAVVRAGLDVPERWWSRLIEVEDPGRALLALAKVERQSSSAIAIGVTGSTGKTCTKDFVASVLERRLRVVKSPASFNNEVGLPLTILSAPEDAEAIVCEMGSRGLGHIKLLCDVARPAIGVVTNVGVAHMELFGSADALRRAKKELPEALPPDGTAVLNADDPVVLGYAEDTVAAVVTFGLSNRADVRAESVRLDPGTGRASFDLVAREGRVSVTLPVPGEHMVPNALAAAAVGLRLDVGFEDCAEGLAAATVSSGRMEVFDTPAGIRVVDDAYNANPTSMAAALRAARWMAGRGRCIAVLGAMAELGPIAGEEHERIGELLARLGIDILVVVGPQAELIAVGTEREGVEPERIYRCVSLDEAEAVLRSVARPGDLVLVKASRVARFDRLVQALRRQGIVLDDTRISARDGAGP